MQRNLESISSAIKSFRVMWYISSRFSKLHSLRLVLLVFWSRVWRIDAEMFHVHVIPFPHNNTLCISFFVRWKFWGLSFSISVLLCQLYSFLFCNFVFWIHLLNKSYAESLFCTHCQPVCYGLSTMHSNVRLMRTCCQYLFVTVYLWPTSWASLGEIPLKFVCKDMKFSTIKIFHGIKLSTMHFVFY